MPYVNINGAKLSYTDHGKGKETILFVHGLLMSGAMFSDQIAVLRSAYRCISLDLRGQGKSEVTDSGYDMDSLTDDVVALIKYLELRPCHFVGLSMGGFIGLRLAIHHSELLSSLALLGTSADPEPAKNARKYRLMIQVVKWLGYRPVVNNVINLMFGRTFLSDSAKEGLRKSWFNRIMDNNRAGTVRAATGVNQREGVFQLLKQIHHPCIIMVGDEDVATPPERSSRIHDAIAGSRLVTIARAGHSSTIEQPAAVNAALQDFYAGLTTSQ